MSLTTRILPDFLVTVRSLLGRLDHRHRYVLIGGTVYGFELGVIVIAQRLNASATVAVGISYWLGLLLSFGLQKHVTFKDRRWQRQVLGLQLTLFGLLVTWNFLFTILVTKLLAPPIPAIWCRTIALGVTTIWNYYLYKSRIFKRSGAAPLY